MFIILLLAFSTTSTYTAHGALPQFSWDTLPVFFHSSNYSGQYNHDALQTIAKFQMATIAKMMGLDVPGVDDEDEMVLTMKAIKSVNPKITTYFYMNAYKDAGAMTRMARELKQNPDYYLRDAEGNKVKNSRGLYAFDLSNPKVRKWWLKICLNATKFADGDGCFCDASQHENATFHPSPPESKLKAWAQGLLNLTREVQDALGEDKLLIGKVANQPYVKAVQIEYFRPSNNSIASLLLCAEVGQVVQAHVSIHVPCDTSDLTDHIAAFLIGAGRYAYFGCGFYGIKGNESPVIWRSEYDKPLGEPKGPAMYSNGVWTRSFASGTEVTFDATENKGTIKWGSGLV